MRLIASLNLEHLYPTLDTVKDYYVVCRDILLCDNLPECQLWFTVPTGESYLYNLLRGDSTRK